MFETFSRHWWSLALRGVAAVFFGILALALPGLTLVSLVILFGAYALVDGIFSIVAAVRAAADDLPWGALLLEGFVSVGAGLVAWIWPGLTALALIYVIAAWAFITGAVEIYGAIRLRQELRNEWLLALGGLASIAFGVIAVARPGQGALALLWLIGVYAVFFGIVFILLGVRMRFTHTEGQSSGMTTSHPAPFGTV